MKKKKRKERKEKKLKRYVIIETMETRSIYLRNILHSLTRNIISHL